MLLLVTGKKGIQNSPGLHLAQRFEEVVILLNFGFPVCNCQLEPFAEPGCDSISHRTVQTGCHDQAKLVIKPFTTLIKLQLCQQNSPSLNNFRFVVAFGVPVPEKPEEHDLKRYPRSARLLRNALDDIFRSVAVIVSPPGPRPGNETRLSGRGPAPATDADARRLRDQSPLNIAALETKLPIPGAR